MKKNGIIFPKTPTRSQISHSCLQFPTFFSPLIFHIRASNLARSHLSIRNAQFRFQEVQETTASSVQVRDKEENLENRYSIVLLLSLKRPFFFTKCEAETSLFPTRMRVRSAAVQRSDWRCLCAPLTTASPSSSERPLLLNISLRTIDCLYIMPLSN